MPRLCIIVTGTFNDITATIGAAKAARLVVLDLEV
jgi:hypothetical protein